MIKIRHQKNEHLLYGAGLILLLNLIKIYLGKRISLANCASLIMVVFFLSLYLYYKMRYYLILTGEKIIIDNFFYKKIILIKDIIGVEIIGDKYILKTNSKTFKIYLKSIDQQSAKLFVKKLDGFLLKKWNN